MSFSGMVKEELSRQVSTARHCRIAEIAALLSACGRMTADGILHFQTENYDFFTIERRELVRLPSPPPHVSQTNPLCSTKGKSLTALQ